jgi:hypothetical protein
MFSFLILSSIIVLSHCQIISEISDGQIQIPLTSQLLVQSTQASVLTITNTNNIQPSQISTSLPILSTTNCVTSSLFNCQWVFFPDSLNQCQTSIAPLPSSCTKIPTSIISSLNTPASLSSPSPYVLL